MFGFKQAKWRAEKCHLTLEIWGFETQFCLWTHLRLWNWQELYQINLCVECLLCNYEKNKEQKFDLLSLFEAVANLRHYPPPTQWEKK